ncbi:WxL domain-containing protein [Fructilactobacillus fructivorans]|uniref:WxL domain-containing protein n=1 Tax=Fructilactobacillus fructivorans TaxID=1614 RepID=UPI00070B0AB3|nr:WxL domain-containing protein [Fructilactobacillus fructivorans]KRN39885.1 hypothetical protein IV51_GL000466 [Fructilactobacillus fructivorans]
MEVNIGKKLVLGVASLAAVLGLSVAVGNVNANAATLPADTSTTANDTTGSVSGQSNAHVQVRTGYLTLQEVPDLNFGEADNTSTPQTNIPLHDNQTGLGKPQLVVTDGRAVKDQPNGAGYNVTAALSNFSDGKNTQGNGWGIQLKQGSGLNNDNNVPVNTPLLTAGANNASQVLSVQPGQGLGTTSVDYSKSTDASLNMPANVNPADYNAPITWTLNAAGPQNPTA